MKTQTRLRLLLAFVLVAALASAAPASRALFEPVRTRPDGARWDASKPANFSGRARAGRL